MTRKITLLFFVGVSLALCACAQREETESKTAVRPVKLVTVEEASTRKSMSFPAVIRAAQSSELTFQVPGLLQELAVQEGDEVEKEALIARLDQRDYQANLDSARAQFNNAESEYQRARRLAEEDAISQSVLETRQSQRDIARAALTTAQKALDDATLTAPFAGHVARIFVENFQNVQAKEPIATLQSEGVEAVVNAPATVIAYVPQFEPIDTVVVLDAAPDLKIPATFKEATGAADASAQTYQVSFSFTPPDNLLILPGMTGAVESDFVITGNILEGRLAVPISAVVAEGDDRFVWVVDPETMTVSRRAIKIGRDVGEMIRVTEGLEAGETIVAAGAAYLHEGMTVRAWEQ
ncbi:MAG: efflux RND transporter periplasmic adaptor subunit [Parvularculaceae bacterium]|nr:efflux RND transporter periplasmic adaptor subunit [Parvularculaceae bacterium]